MLGFLAAVTPLALFIVAMIEVARMFWGFAAGRIFEIDTARRIRLIGAAVAMLAVVNPLAGLVQSVILTAGNSSEERLVALSIAYQDCATLLAGLALIAFAEVMKEAVRLADENRGFL